MAGCGSRRVPVSPLALRPGTHTQHSRNPYTLASGTPYCLQSMVTGHGAVCIRADQGLRSGHHSLIGRIPVDQGIEFVATFLATKCDKCDSICQRITGMECLLPVSDGIFNDAPKVRYVARQEWDGLSFLEYPLRRNRTAIFEGGGETTEKPWEMQREANEPPTDALQAFFQEWLFLASSLKDLVVMGKPKPLRRLPRLCSSPQIHHGLQVSRTRLSCLAYMRISFTPEMTRPMSAPKRYWRTYIAHGHLRPLIQQNRV